MSLHDGAFMLRPQIIPTSGDPKAVKRKSHGEDKLSEEGSRLAWMDLDPRLYSNVRENNLTSLVSRDPITNAATICLLAEPGKSIGASEGEGEVWRAAKMRRSCFSQPSLSSSRSRVLVFSWSLITLISWSRPHKKQMSMSHKGKSVFREELNSWRCQCFDLVDKASRQLLNTRGWENVKQQAATATLHAA